MHSQGENISHTRGLVSHGLRDDVDYYIWSYSDARLEDDKYDVLLTTNM